MVLESSHLYTCLQLHDNHELVKTPMNYKKHDILKFFSEIFVDFRLAE